MNHVTVEYVDECLGKSSSLRRAAAEVVLPHTYSRPYGNPLLRCQQLVLAVDRHSLAGVRPGGLHLDRRTAATHVVTGAERTDPEPDPVNPTGVHSIGDDEQLAEDFGQLVAPGQPLDDRDDEVVEDLGR